MQLTDINGNIYGFNGLEITGIDGKPKVPVIPATLIVNSTPITGGAVGRILFEGAGNVLQESSNLFWDNVNNRLGIGTATPAFSLDVNGSDAGINTLTIGLGSGQIFNNTAVGTQALLGNTTGAANTAVGYFALENNTTGSNNSAFGYASLLSNLSTSNHTAIGLSSLRNITSGSYNTALGTNAGRYIADGTTNLTTSNVSLFLGSNTKALANSQTNQIVIGYDATGLGSNSVVLGNSSITLTALRGNVLINTTTDAGYRLDVNGSVRTTGSISAASAIARGTYLNQTLVATANNDVLVGLDISPTFTTGAFTGVTSAALRVNGSIIGIGTSGTILPLVNTAGTGTVVLGGTSPNTPAIRIQGSPLNFFIGSTQVAQMFATTGNLLLQNGGTFTDAGYRLDVNGTARVSGTTTITPATLTGSSATSALDISQTWNTTGTPIALKVNITDTASASNSDLMQLQVGGSTRFRVLKSGFFTFNTGGEIAGTLLVGGTSINASAFFEIRSTTRGFLPPRLTNAQMLAIASPAAGLVVYDTTNNKHYGYDGTTWNAFF